MKPLNELFRMVELKNELDNNLYFALRFSDPDGVRSGKSGWSFGQSQFDTQNNSEALKCLQECGFTQFEIDGIVDQTINTGPFAARLAAHADIIAKYDEAQFTHCLNKALNFDIDFGIPVENPGGILASADYVNQYGSQGNGAKTYYKALGRPVTALDVLNFKLTNTKYGREHPKDCRRRYNNIMGILNEIREVTHEVE